MMTNVEIVKKHLEGFTGDAWLVKAKIWVKKEIGIRGYKVKYKTRYFVVSGTNAMLTGWEVLAFPADKNGKVLSWIEVAGGRGISHEETIKELGEAM